MDRAVNGTATTTPGRGGDPRGAVGKALEVLAALTQPGGPHRLADLAKRCDLPKPTAHRMLQTMADAGFAVGADGQYHVGPRLLGLSAAVLATSEVAQFARPVLRDLRRRTGHTVHYAVRHGDQAVYVEKVEPDQAYRMNTRVGGEVPLYCTAIGRAILSRLPRGEVDAILAGPLPARTPRTLTDPAAIRRELSTVDERGFVVDDEQYEQHVRCVAAPVVDRHGQVAGAISVSSLTFTLPLDGVDVLGPLVAEAAARVSGALSSGPAMRLVSDEE
nr:IclR family transcriptional regulator [Kibdelosporangium sp. MJ126-NF4]CEL20797.1 Transcriptional regulator, IclR family [Kibdelosporangium sp. MJ126-NF4]CTQ98398.1 Transcriptional regulator, IclR family [Kibdelosporangium sp. MJ126-NF4]